MNPKGQLGEKLAELWLLKKGYSIQKRNFRTRRGEVDIIAKKGDIFIFVEVKMWHHKDEISLERAINPVKQGRIMDTAQAFLEKENFLYEISLQFDVIFIYDGKIKHIENAFPIC